ncbi:MAG: two-component regulator propeller domain-containing protein [Cyclobacteriaceae bacterium]
MEYEIFKRVNLPHVNTLIIKDQVYWLGTGHGLFYIDKKKEQVKRYLSEVHNKNSIGGNEVRDLHPDSRGFLWIATSNGISRLTIKTGEIKNYFTDQGLIYNTVQKIEEDDKGNLWFICLNGISKFDPSREIFINYTARDGLLNKIFNIYKTREGKFILPTGHRGFYYFHPSSIMDEKDNSPFYITDMHVSGKKVHATGYPLYDTAIFLKNRIELRYSEKSLQFKFSSLNYNNAGHDLFAYKINEADTSWNFLGNERNLALVKLDPGNYNLQLARIQNNGEKTI